MERPRVPSPQDICQQALEQLQENRSEKAAELLETALTLDPNHAPALNFLTLAYCDLEQMDRAEATLQRLVSACPTNKAIPTLKCLCYLKQSQLDFAIAALELPPHFPSPLERRPELWAFPPLSGRLALEVESWLLPLEIPQLHAHAALQQAPDMTSEDDGPDPNRIPATLLGLTIGSLLGLLIGFALIFYMRRQLDIDVMDVDGLPNPAMLATSIFGLAGASWGFLRPRLVGQYRAQLKQRQGYSLLDKAMRTRNENQRQQLFWLAISAMREVPSLDSQALRSYYTLGESLLIAAASCPQSTDSPKYLQEAENCFLKSWAQDGENPYLNYYLGRSCQLQGKIEAAATYYERAIEKFDKLSEGHYALGQCQLLLGDRPKALYWFQRALGTELQLARDRLIDLSETFLQGKLAHKPAMPARPLPEPLEPETSTAQDAAALATLPVLGQESSTADD